MNRCEITAGPGTAFGGRRSRQESTTAHSSCFEALFEQELNGNASPPPVFCASQTEFAARVSQAREHLHGNLAFHTVELSGPTFHFGSPVYR
ncbi:MAG: hypothetical protein KC910_14145 [Candidatus Eremiobacteraeota bacterium]|nr:hypothetical protein [Candidatus Eremiobacteraeota bacterium]